MASTRATTSKFKQSPYIPHSLHNKVHHNQLGRCHHWQALLNKIPSQLLHACYQLF